MYSFLVGATTSGHKINTSSCSSTSGGQNSTVGPKFRVWAGLPSFWKLRGESTTSTFPASTGAHIPWRVGPSSILRSVTPASALGTRHLSPWTLLPLSYKGRGDRCGSPGQSRVISSPVPWSGGRNPPRQVGPIVPVPGIRTRTGLGRGRGAFLCAPHTAKSILF